MSDINLLCPSDYIRNNYIHQLRETIAAYSVPMIVLGETLQNSIDAVCQNKNIDKGKISVNLDFDSNTVIVKDNGIGFPKETSLLYLGGTGKYGLNTKGKIGVGIKATLFSTKKFSIKSNTGRDSWKVEIEDACEYGSIESINIPEPFPIDPNPLDCQGTEVAYSFGSDLYFDDLIKEIVEKSLPNETEKGFGSTIVNFNTGFPSSFAALLASFLRRFTYVGDVLTTMEIHNRYPANGIDIEVTINCSEASNRFEKPLDGWYGLNEEQTFKVEPSYLNVKDTLKWVPKGKKAPKLFHDQLGDGGENLERTDGFNLLTFKDSSDYEKLLINKRGSFPTSIEDYRRNLFPKINGIQLIIGRIPEFERFLPGGSRRIISCNGVVTSHDIDLTSGRNQEYVRCFDLIIDLKANLNYGKTQITSGYLVRKVRDFINESYSRVIQNAAGQWVGRMNIIDDDEDEVFVGRKDLGIDTLILRKVPVDENDVIALFFELAGMGHFSQYRVYGLSQKSIYDCRAAIVRPYDQDKEKDVLNPVDDSKLRTVEFKLYASDVMKDFDRAQKFARELDLVIAWDEGAYDSNNYTIYEIDQSEAYKNSPSKVFPMVTRYVYDAKEGSEVQVIILKEIIESMESE